MSKEETRMSGGKFPLPKDQPPSRNDAGRRMLGVTPQSVAPSLKFTSRSMLQQTDAKPDDEAKYPEDHSHHGSCSKEGELSIPKRKMGASFEHLKYKNTGQYIDSDSVHKVSQVFDKPQIPKMREDSLMQHGDTKYCGSSDDVQETRKVMSSNHILSLHKQDKNCDLNHANSPTSLPLLCIGHGTFADRHSVNSDMKRTVSSVQKSPETHVLGSVLSKDSMRHDSSDVTSGRISEHESRAERTDLTLCSRLRQSDVTISGYDFKSVRQKFETLSKSHHADHNRHSCVRSKSFQRSPSPSLRLHCPKLSSSSLPTSPSISIATFTPSLHSMHTSEICVAKPDKYSRLTPESANAQSVFRSASTSDLPTSSTSIENMQHKINVPKRSLSVKEAVAHFSRLDSSSQSQRLQNSRPKSCMDIPSSENMSSKSSLGMNSASLVSLDQQNQQVDHWLQSSFPLKETENLHKDSNIVHKMTSGISLGPNTKLNSKHLQSSKPSKSAQEPLQRLHHSQLSYSRRKSGGSDDYHPHLTTPLCKYQSSSPHNDPPVTICVTQEPDEVESQFLTSGTGVHVEDDLNIQHLPLSPRSSFGSVCSFKSSNADSAVDMNNPDEEQSDVSSQKQRSPKLSVCSEVDMLDVSLPPSPYKLSMELPKLVVSDHSCSTLTTSVTSQAGEHPVDDLDFERIPRPWSPEDSAYSGTSDLSMDDTEDEEPAPPPKKKQSSWKIIRSIVRWSPFVQVFKKNKYPWIQLAGHQGNFQAGEAGAVLKKLDTREKQCYQNLMSDSLKPFVPEYRGDTEKSGDKYIQLQDLLCEFNIPSVMDIKMGCRTYLEEELEKARSKPTLRKDMYKKMIEVDPNAPSPEEREKEGVTKARYLQWRDEMSSSVNLGFRIEGIKKSDGSSSKDFKKTKTKEHVKEKLKSFIGENTNAVAQYIERLKAVRSAQETSEFFSRHEVISSSLLFVHDSEKANVWMIDFGKTEPLPSHVKIDHRNQWQEGNHEDGYLEGLDGLVDIFTDLLNES